jgi:hypothetical protein
MLSHFNLCLVKTAKTAFETFHTPVNHCEIWIGTLLHGCAPEYKFKRHQNVTSIHQAAQKKQKIDQWELVFGNSGTTFDPTSKKKKKIWHTFNAQSLCKIHSDCAKLSGKKSKSKLN